MKQDFALGHVEVAMTPQQRFEWYLQSRQKRTTRERRIIVDKVFDRHDHFDAEFRLRPSGRRMNGTCIGQVCQ